MYLVVKYQLMVEVHLMMKQEMNQEQNHQKLDFVLKVFDLIFLIVRMIDVENQMLKKAY
jgi:hypothetical protein